MHTETTPTAHEPADLDMTPSIKVDPTLAGKGHIKPVNPAIQVDCAGMTLEGSQTF